MAFDIERFKSLSPEAQQIVFERKGLSPEAQQVVMQKINPTQQIQSQMQPQPSDIQGRQQAEGPGLYGKIRPYIKSAAEAVGAGGGSIVGTAAGPVGTVAGGTLGYMGAGELMDLLDWAFDDKAPQSIKKEAKQQLQRAIEGATITAGGEIAGPLISGTVKIPGRLIGKVRNIIPEIPVVSGAIKMPGRIISKAREVVPAITEKGIQKKAGKVLSEVGVGLSKEQVKKNVAIAAELEKKIPGLKFTFGQITNDADAIALENALARMAVKTRQGGMLTGRELSQQQNAFANKSLQEYYNKVLTGKGNISDFTKKVAEQEGSIKAAKKVTEDKVKAEISRIGRAMDEQNIGRGILKEVKDAEEIAKKKAKQLYDKIPNVKLPSKGLSSDIRSLVESENKIIEPRTKKMVSLLKLILKSKKKSQVKNALLLPSKYTAKAVEEHPKVGYQALRSVRSRIGRKIEEAKYAEEFEDARQLTILKNKIDDAMSQVKEVNPMIEKLYNDATKFYREEYVPKFRRGTIADILRQGGRGEETKIALSGIAKEFWSKDGMDYFLKTVGDNKIATDLMKDYAKYDLLNRGAINPATGEISTTMVFRWLQKNSSILKKLKIYDEFKNTANLTRSLDKVSQNLDVFNKSIAGKVLNADVDNVVAQAFSGKGMVNPARTASELLKLAQGDKAAEAGIKKAFAEHLLEKSKKPTFDIFENPEVAVNNMTKMIKKFSPAIRTFYKNDPKKLKALMDIHKAYEIVNRTAKPSTSGVSEVADNLLGVISGAGVSKFGRYRLIVKIPDLISKYSKNQVNEYLMRAMFEPDYAIALKRYLKTPKDKKVATRFTQLMFQLAGVGAKSSAQEKEQGGQ